MDLQYFEKLISIFDNSKAEEIEIEEEGITIKLSKSAKVIEGNNSSTGSPIIQFHGGGMPNYAPAQYAAPPAVQAQSAPAEQIKPVLAEVATPVDDNAGLHEIKSPIVGTFYGTPSPDSDPFVEVGSKVSVGSTLCIVEAMKLMNEIESDVSGTVVKILLKNAQPVEFNQPLFVIKPD